jgi:hypothetical protein
VDGNRLYAEQGQDADEVGQAIMLIAQEAQAAGFPEPAQYHRPLYELRNNFKKFIQERRAQRPFWEIDIEEILARRAAAVPR